MVIKKMTSHYERSTLKEKLVLGWFMDEWVDVKAFLRIAYSASKRNNFLFPVRGNATKWLIDKKR